MLNYTSVLPLSLYIHFPWCVRKCPYCDFNSHAVRDGIPEAAFIDALLADVDGELPRVWGRSLTSIFIGGGTPSLLSAEALDRLLSGLRARFGFEPDLEVTLEANPGTLEQGRFAEYRAAGINRLSIGVQSFDDARLEAIGRIHTGAEAAVAAEAAHRCGLDNFNLDLMYGLPGQSPEAALSDLEQAIALEPAHLSYYQLTLEPNTAFHQAPPPLPDDESLWTMHRQGRERLTAAGYRPYEISAFARPGQQCIHNLNYWRFGDYLGIGPGAHGKRTDTALGRIVRCRKPRHPDAWLAQASSGEVMGEQHRVGRFDVPLEFMMNALRLFDGFEPQLFEQRTGLPLYAVEKPLRVAEERGLIHWGIDRISATERGRNYLNELLEGFLPD
ncbi:radical SAM family heme chaperone HemW [Thiohalomonas denitrificans]|uniref:radical SAM family heme chaperone HemW n=1 Tax=Thiohalomonas denitrificans TaxID=415747 RepID=UPI0026F1C945|nr:radical SAM family heme chaperone HemW [Thiohalomonas denitrificans]